MSANPWEDEVFWSLRRSRNIAWGLAGASLIVAGLAVTAVAGLTPLKERQPYVILVDRTTGEAEQIVRVAAVSLGEREAVLQAELVSYVTERETYDPHDNAERLRTVVARSDGQAAESWRALWSSDNEQHPATVYGPQTRITVRIVSVSELSAGTAQVRFERTLRAPNTAPTTARYVATVAYEFRPRREQRLEAVWANPFGFTVTSYRVDAETIGAF